MMNLIQVQDDLKNFSQDQLVNEMQKPSGNAPQFLVLAELNRRKRVKGDLESRQAQQQPTVAEEVVAAAGVPQNQMMGMSEAMAPQSAASDGVGTSAPMKMASGGLMQFGNDIRNSMSQQIDPYLEEIENEAESKFNIDLDQNNNMSLMRPMPFEPLFPRPGYRGPIAMPNVGISGKGLARPSVLERGPQSSVMNPPREQLLSAPFASSLRGYAEGGVIRAQDGLPKETNYGDDFLEYIKGMPSAMYDTGNAALNFLSPRLEGMEPNPEDTGFESMLKGAGRNINLLADIPSGIYSGAKSITEPIADFFTKPGNAKELEKEETKDAENIDQALNEAPKMPEATPEQKLNLTSDEEKPLTIEQELLKRQKALEKDRNFDKYMALAQVGLGMLASEKPTLAQAIGEGGQAGLTAYEEANKRYQEGLNDILNARSKLQQAKIKASSQGILDRKGALSALSSYNNDISAVRKQIGDIQETAMGSPTPEQQKQIAALQEELNRLRFEQAQLYGEAGIRQRPTIKVAELPSTKKGE